MTPFNTPQPPQPRPGEVVDWNGWDILLRHADIKMRHEAAANREAQEERAIAANAALAASNDRLAEAVVKAAELQIEAASLPQPPDSPAKLLQNLAVALAAAGVDSACVLPQAQAILAATTPREMPPQVLPRPAA